MIVWNTKFCEMGYTLKDHLSLNVTMIDDLFRRASPLGDPEVKYPEKSSEYASICNEQVNYQT